MRKPTFCICENKDADQLNPKFQTSSHLLELYSPVCVDPGQKPERLFSHDAAQMGKNSLTSLKAACLLASRT